MNIFGPLNNYVFQLFPLFEEKYPLCLFGCPRPEFKCDLHAKVIDLLPIRHEINNLFVQQLILAHVIEALVQPPSRSWRLMESLQY